MIGHAVRAAALVRVVGALLIGGKLSLTQLGRGLTGVARVKHQIKAIERLLGNEHPHRERDDIYRALARALLAGTRRLTRMEMARVDTTFTSTSTST